MDYKTKGRPIKDIKQTKRVVAYLTEQEYDLLKEFAENNLISIAAITRKLLIEGLKK